MSDEFYGELVAYDFDGDFGVYRRWLTKAEAQKIGEEKHADTLEGTPSFAYCETCMKYMNFDRKMKVWQCPKCGNEIDTDRYEEVCSDLFWEEEDE